MSLAKDSRQIAGPASYDEDFTAWAFEQAELLRRGQLADADLPHLAEEIESLGNEQIHALESFYTLLIFHLLKWQFQPDRRSRSWDLTIFMSYANIRVYKNGVLEGEALYDATGGGLTLSKFIDAETKVRELVNQLFP